MTFVFVNSLNLDVEQAFRVDFDFAFSLDPFSQLNFVFLLDSSPFVSEFRVINVLFKFSQLGHVQNPFISFEILTVKFGQSRICAENPSSCSNSVCLVDEFVWENFVEIFEKVRFQKLRVKIGNTIDLVRTDNAKVGHTNSLWNTFLDQRKNIHLMGISWVLLANSGQPEVVNQVNEFQMSWQKSVQEFNTPFFKGFW